jgi:curved DNA-binding protein CbpA
MAPDPYQTLGISSDAPDAEVRKAYRRLVQKYHPDHNNGSHESERRFEEVQEAYAKIRQLRAAGIKGAGTSGAGRASGGPRSSGAGRASGGPRSSGAPRAHGAGSTAPPPPPSSSFDPDIEARAAALERELKEAHLARERAREAARRAAAESARRAAADAARDGGAQTSADGRRPGRASDEELGYIKTDDSFMKILSDAKDELSDRFSDAHGHPVVRRVSDLIDELDELASKLTGDRGSREKK